MTSYHCSFIFFFFNDTATTEIYTLSLHDALPICLQMLCPPGHISASRVVRAGGRDVRDADRKSTRLNSSHGYISYAVFCLKKKKKQLDAQIPSPRLAKRIRELNNVHVIQDRAHHD